MYVFLILTGTALVFYGAWVRSKNSKNNDSKSIKFVDASYNIKDSESELHKRIEALELIIRKQEELEAKSEIEVESIYPTDEEIDSFNEILQEAIEHESIEAEKKTVKKPSSEAERVELIRKLEKGEYSIEEVCTILSMEKGEVLLLKNIYRNYQT